MKYIILSEKKWNASLADELSSKTGHEWCLINNKSDFSLDNLRQINPDKIFIPHWSQIIPNEILDEFECIIFHMTDLPYGRGGSPLQNLIVNGNKNTKISAIRAVEELDAGDVYCKEDLDLTGTATEIFERANGIVESMIYKIIAENLQPTPQEGEATYFKRRKPEQSNISSLDSIDDIYDHIRMLDAEGYPKAFFETEHFKFEYSNSKKLDNEQIIEANVRIIKK